MHYRIACTNRWYEVILLVLIVNRDGTIPILELELNRHCFKIDGIGIGIESTTNSPAIIGMEDIVIDREAREIMYLVASVRPSVSQHFAALGKAVTDGRTDGRTEGRTDGHYQVHYLPASRSIIKLLILSTSILGHFWPISTRLTGTGIGKGIKGAVIVPSLVVNIGNGMSILHTHLLWGHTKIEFNPRVTRSMFG